MNIILLSYSLSIYGIYRRDSTCPATHPAYTINTMDDAEPTSSYSWLYSQEHSCSLSSISCSLCAPLFLVIVPEDGRPHGLLPEDALSSFEGIRTPKRCTSNTGDINLSRIDYGDPPVSLHGYGNNVDVDFTLPFCVTPDHSITNSRYSGKVYPASMLLVVVGKFFLLITAIKNNM